VTALATVRSPIGPITVEASDRGVCGVELRRAGSAAAPARGGDGRWVGAPSPPISAAQEEHLRRAVEALRGYFRGLTPALPPLDLAGSDFDRRVWGALVDIPWGETVTYGELAARLGKPGAARAVGAANGRNPVAILVPCHRVVAAGGGLGGYAGGLDVKRWLLAHEASHAPLRLS
jgi:methylated-DNA-[protein]-cysteine S-methyltransferase